MNKIRTLIAYDDIEITNDVENCIKDLDYIEVIAKTINGKDTYNKIVELKPEIVFTKFNMLDMGAMEIMQKTKDKLNEETPVFNIFEKQLSEQTIDKAYNIVGKKLNALVDENDHERIVTILKEYKAYKEFKNV